VNGSVAKQNPISRIEFAKRLFLNGKEITPMAPDLLLLADQSLYGMVNLLREMEFKG